MSYLSRKESVLPSSWKCDIDVRNTENHSLVVNIELGHISVSYGTGNRFLYYQDSRVARSIMLSYFGNPLQIFYMSCGLSHQCKNASEDQKKACSRDAEYRIVWTGTTAANRIHHHCNHKQSEDVSC